MTNTLNALALFAGVAVFLGWIVGNCWVWERLYPDHPSRQFFGIIFTSMMLPVLLVAVANDVLAALA